MSDAQQTFGPPQPGVPTCDVAALQAEYEEMKRRGGGSFWKMDKAGDFDIRIMPAFAFKFGEAAVSRNFYTEVSYHYKIGVGEKPPTVLCWKSVGYTACPACDLVDRLFDSDDDALNKIAKKVLAKRKMFVNLIDLNNPGSGVQIGTLPVSVVKQILGFMTDPMWGDLTDLYTGRPIRITRAAETSFDMYNVRPFPNAEPVGTPEVIADLWEQMANLDKVVRTPKTAEEMGKIVSEATDAYLNPAGLGPSPELPASPQAQQPMTSALSTPLPPQEVPAPAAPAPAAPAAPAPAPAAPAPAAPAPAAPAPAAPAPAAPAPAAPAPAAPAPAAPAPAAPATPPAPAGAPPPPASAAPAASAIPPEIMAKIQQYGVADAVQHCFGRGFNQSNTNCTLCPNSAECQGVIAGTM